MKSEEGQNSGPAPTPHEGASTLSTWHSPQRGGRERGGGLPYTCSDHQGGTSRDRVRTLKAGPNCQTGDAPAVHLKIDCVELTAFSPIKTVL